MLFEKRRVQASALFCSATVDAAAGGKKSPLFLILLLLLLFGIRFFASISNNNSVPLLGAAAVVDYDVVAAALFLTVTISTAFSVVFVILVQLLKCTMYLPPNPTIQQAWLCP